MSISKLSITSILLLSASLSGCSTEQADKDESMDFSASQLSDINATNDLKLSNDMQKTSQDTSELLVLEGQILFQQLEGGFFGFIDESGNKYTPIGMDKADLRHGLVIQLTGKLLPDMITTTQFGQVIKVESIMILDESKAQKPGQPNLRDKDL
jgi:outer membrane murein-binding lipoprotein Lpp